MSRWSVVSVALAGSVALVGCGDGGGGSGSVSAKERPYVEAVAEGIRSDSSFPGGAANADCLAAGIVNIIGLETLETANIGPDELTNGESLNLSVVGEQRVDDLVDFLLDGDCFDMRQLMAESISSEAGGQITDKQASCIAGKVLDQRGFRDVLTGSLIGTADESKMMEAMGDVFGYLSECGVSIADLSS